MKVVYDPKKGKPKKRTAHLTWQFIQKWQAENLKRGLVILGVTDKNSKK